MYGGDKILDSDNNLLLFEETATTPTALIALNIAIWYACLEDHTATNGDAVQAFLQSERKGFHLCHFSQGVVAE